MFGLTPAKYQSGEVNRTGAISKCGDEMMRVMLYEAAQVMLTRTNKWSWLKAWAMKIARHRGMKKAIVALARRLAVIMHRIWAVSYTHLDVYKRQGLEPGPFRRTHQHDLRRFVEHHPHHLVSTPRYHTGSVDLT